VSQLDPSSPAEIKAALDSKSPDELTAAIQAQEGGIDGFLDGVFQAMCQAFNPAKAGGQQANVQYEIGTPEGTKTYGMRVAGGTCEVARGAIDNPRVTIRIGLVDFLSLLTGRANGMQLFMGGKLKLAGDMFFAQTFQSWFNQPS